MKKTIILSILGILLFASNSFAGNTLLVQAAAGGWYASTSGETGYKSSSDISLDDNLGYDETTTLEGRIKAYLPVFPNIYIMGAAVNMDEKGDQAGFNFGGSTFNDPFTSEMNINQYDMALFWEVPFLSLATLGNLRVEGGLNMRMIDTDMEIKDSVKKVSKDTQTWVPMLYGAGAISIFGGLSVEAEARVSSYDNQQWFSGIARIKQDIAHIMFISGGYRYDDIDMDTDGLRLDTEIKGPFIEFGVFL
ncbi:TIGR04219 family outer membrane beta-barrel protein [Desulforegula conservatrix]|uniref:TIGR04219 family outer membrane beta-barrel protein n=1 Tax=Desulforegula conservatrix TaxID=153026 RepID=UPI000426240E|nr:TIGR04219 family outer membrane beta-barrel protein [Desulforegula conservatrix]